MYSIFMFQTAHEIGNGSPRPMVVRLTQPEDKYKIYCLLKNLLGVKNSEGRFYFVNNQLPDEYNENDRRCRQIIAENKRLPVSHQLTMNLRKVNFLLTMRYIDPRSNLCLPGKFLNTQMTKKNNCQSSY